MSEAKVIRIEDYFDEATVQNVIDEIKAICIKYGISHNQYAFKQKGKSTFLNIDLSIKIK